MTKRPLLTSVFFALLAVACHDEILESNSVTDTPDDIQPETPVTGKYANCLYTSSANTLDVVTWNIEQFPKNASTTAMLSEMIQTMDADIIAVQEINSLDGFNELIASLHGWSGKLHLNGSLGQGFLYKTSEVSLSELTLLFEDDTYAFPRPVVVATATHVSVGRVTLVNIHLKCCNDGEDRRHDASAKLKSFLDSKLSSEPVIVLGDFNDLITDPASTNVFHNFIADAANYEFADMDVAQGPATSWSYPAWPSHVDHVLISNELFESVLHVRTVNFPDCEADYNKVVSDHLPLMMRLK